MPYRIDVFPSNHPDGDSYIDASPDRIATLVERHGTHDADIQHMKKLDAIAYIHYRNVVIEVDGVMYLAAHVRNRNTKRNTSPDV